MTSITLFITSFIVASTISFGALRFNRVPPAPPQTATVEVAKDVPPPAPSTEGSLVE